MPGFQVSTTATAGPTTDAPGSSKWFVTGLAQRGPTDKAVECYGMADFVENFGDRQSYGFLYDSVKQFFDQGGALAVVTRVVGATATEGTLVLQDKATTPAPTLNVTATSAGDWSANLSITVSAGLIANTFRLQVLLNGVIVEDYNNLVSPADAVSKTSGSRYIAVTDAGSASVAPTNNPANITATPLSAGTDDRAAVQETDYVNALENFTDDYETGAVSIPGVGPTAHSGIIAHCVAHNRVAILSTTRGATKSDLLSLAGTQNSEYATIVGQWIQVSDGAGGTYTIPPDGYAAGARSIAHQLVGAWRMPAGDLVAAQAIVGLDVRFSDSDADDLDSAGISVIREVGGVIELYGWTSLSTDKLNYGTLAVRDLLNVLVIACVKAIRPYLFAPIDGSGALLSDVNGALVGVISPIATAGGLYALADATGNVIDPGYSVDTSSNVNSAASLASNKVVAVVGVRPAPSAAKILLQIVRNPTNVAVVAATQQAA